MAETSSSPVRAPGAFFTPDELYALKPLHLRARTIAEGTLVGTHKSRRFGSSTEFAEHKLYAPGDELKHLDWRAYGRVDRYFVRRYLEEANLDIHIVVDASASMQYAGGARGKETVSKWEVARTLAAGIATLAHDQSDAAGISIFAAEEKFVLPPRSRRDHLGALLDELGRTDAGGATNLTVPLHALATRLNRRALVIVLTDLLDVPFETLAPLGVFRRRGSDVMVLHVMHEDELHFPFDGVVRFLDLEGTREVQVDAPAIRDSYLEELHRFLERWKADAAERDIQYVLASTERSPISIIQEALSLGRGRR